MKKNESVRKEVEKIIKNVSEFKYTVDLSKLKDPIKLEIPHTEFWKIHLLKIYLYSQEGNEPYKAYDLQDILSISVRHIYKHLNNFIENGYLEKINNGVFKFTKKGVDKALEIKSQNYMDRAL